MNPRTELAEGRSCSRRPIRRSRWSIRRSRWHQTGCSAVTISSRPRRTVVPLLVISIHASLLPLISFWRRWRTSISRHRHVTHIPTSPSHSQIMQRLLEILHIPAGISDLALHSRVDLSILSRLPHLIRSVDNGPFSVYLALEVLYRLIFVHLGGVVCPRWAALLWTTVVASEMVDKIGR